MRTFFLLHNFVKIQPESLKIKSWSSIMLTKTDLMTTIETYRYPTFLLIFDFKQ